MARDTFDIISTTKISENKELVISKTTKGDYVIATRAVIEENGRPKYYYDKGSLIIDSKYQHSFREFIGEVYDKEMKKDND